MGVGTIYGSTSGIGIRSEKGRRSIRRNTAFLEEDGNRLKHGGSSSHPAREGRKLRRIDMFFRKIATNRL
jgi:hypothetical protein